MSESRQISGLNFGNSNFFELKTISKEQGSELMASHGVNDKLEQVYLAISNFDQAELTQIFKKNSEIKIVENCENGYNPWLLLAEIEYILVKLLMSASLDHLEQFTTLVKTYIEKIKNSKSDQNLEIFLIQTYLNFYQCLYHIFKGKFKGFTDLKKTIKAIKVLKTQIRENKPKESRLTQSELFSDHSKSSKNFNIFKPKFVSDQVYGGRVKMLDMFINLLSLFVSKFLKKSLSLFLVKIDLDTAKSLLNEILNMRNHLSKISLVIYSLMVLSKISRAVDDPDIEEKKNATKKDLEDKFDTIYGPVTS